MPIIFEFKTVSELQVSVSVSVSVSVLVSDPTTSDSTTSDSLIINEVINRDNLKDLGQRLYVLLPQSEGYLTDDCFKITRDGSQISFSELIQDSGYRCLFQELVQSSNDDYLRKY